ncbi:Cholesterol 7-desaturase [Eumeta japonica]|uniref:cholesterol 7-desaturase n=1 Tax=Eumeta variegata TaxID=151549 RepID=A0A4C2A4R9_EUMVA|nr:Cholesterol 7-desaturase [Eumeta japonica]
MPFLISDPFFQDLLDVGYDHVPRGPNRKDRISRIQEARRLGTKLPPPYPNGWFAIAESRDLKIGSVIGVDALGQNLCLYRAEDGRPLCVDAYCPHLGANMGAGGAVSGRCIECPFHKWQFDGSTGACAAVPGMDSPPKGVSVKSWHTREVDCAVWIWHDAEDREPLWEIEDAPELGSWAYRGRNEFIVNSHIQDIPENGADVAHLNAVHSTSVLTKLAEKYPFLLNFIVEPVSTSGTGLVRCHVFDPSLLIFVGQHVWSAQWDKDEDHTSEMRLRHEYKLGTIGLFRMEVLAKQVRVRPPRSLFASLSLMCTDTMRCTNWMYDGWIIDFVEFKFKFKISLFHRLQNNI